ncbi:MAG: hypothetical protein M3Y24_06400 [Acidobacteriota bacterium]|nr:hypothetical protein [Acidobacteriota bacterium]
MSRYRRLIGALFFLSSALLADDQALWREYGLVHSETVSEGKLSVTKYAMKDLTGALAAWEWLRSPDGRPCDLAPFCTADANRTVVFDYNHVLVYTGGSPTKAQVAAAFNAIPNKRDSSLPAILTFIPKQGLVPNSTRYILGPVSLAAFAPQLASAKAGFESGAEAQVAEYKVAQGRSEQLAIFYYATPEMARLYAAKFKSISGVHVKRSRVLVALVSGALTDAQADTLLSRVQYEAKITWNDTPPPSPIKPLYQLFWNIIYLSVILTALCLVSGLIYAGMRVYRRRYGTLSEDEAMTTLHLR